MVRIRPAEAGDFDRVMVLLRQLWPSVELRPETLRAIFGECIASPNWVCLCADVDGRIAGFGSVNIRESLWQQGRVAHVEVLVVDAEVRSQGIGAAIMDVVTEESGSRGCAAIELNSALHRDSAHRFYEKLGFNREGYAFWREV